MKIFISGIAGFLGSHIADKMISMGHMVSGCDNLIGGYLDNVPDKANFYQVDCNDYSTMTKITKGIDIVIHCAATAYEGLSVFSPNIVTQNIDDLHEKGGSTKVHHLHGEINKARSTVDPSLIYDLNHWEMKIGDTCDNGSQLRPHIVWFGEPVPMIDQVIHFFEMADKIIVIGTSLAVYPAAGLINYASPGIEKYYIDPKGVSNMDRDDFTVIAKKAVDGLSELVKLLNEKSGL